MDADEIKHLRAIRLYELEQALPLLHPGERLLEIGAGHGWQAKRLAESGMKVVALDVPESRYSARGVWPVILYDGNHIPLAHHSVDVIFTANMLLLHPHLGNFQDELKRVLKPGGYAIHLLPNTTWRIWTLLTFYPNWFKRLYRKFTLRRSKSALTAHHAKMTSSSRISRLLSLIFPGPLGIRGNALSELYYFSTYHWANVFESTGWQVISTGSTGLFYTGSCLLDVRLSIPIRRRLGRILGTVCQIYVVHPRP